MKKYNPCEYRKTIRMSTEKGSNQYVHRKMEESGWIQGKTRIRASIENMFKWVPEKGPINVCTKKWKNPGDYQEKV